MDRCTVPQDRHLSVQLQTNLVKEITDEMACDVRVRVKSKEYLRLECGFLVEPQGNRADNRDLSPVAPDWRNGGIGAFFRPSLRRYWNIPIRRLVDAEDRLAVS
jgi:hypothetical protein